MNPAAIILAYISFWSIAVVGGYLIVVGLGNLREHSVSGQAEAPHVPLQPLWRGLVQLRDLFLVLLGTVLAVSGMVFLYMMVYG